MSDDASKTGEPDRSLVSLGQTHEVQYWSRRFDVSEDQLRAAVKAVGNSVVQVSAWLRSKK